MEKLTDTDTHRDPVEELIVLAVGFFAGLITGAVVSALAMRKPVDLSINSSGVRLRVGGKQEDDPPKSSSSKEVVKKDS